MTLNGAIMQLVELRESSMMPEALKPCFDKVIETISECEEPPAQPERKRGKWIDYSEDGYVECPFCHSATNCDDNIDELHFCFSCGARMEV